MLRTTRGWQSCSRTTGEGGLRSVHAIGPGPACSHWGRGRGTTWWVQLSAVGPVFCN